MRKEEEQMSLDNVWESQYEPSAEIHLQREVSQENWFLTCHFKQKGERIKNFRAAALSEELFCA